MSGVTEFAINGRFLAQPVTGVQRYALSVVKAMDVALPTAPLAGRVIAPHTALDPGFAALPFVRVGPGEGHAWEQAVLPMWWRGRLLNLCNTAPVTRADQVVCIHDTNVFVVPDSYGRAFRAAYVALQPLVARRAVRIATVSNASATLIARHLPVRAVDIAVLPNGHEHALAWDPARAQVAPAFLEASLSRPDSRFVLALGSRALHKNIDLLIRTAPALADLGVDVIVAGGGADIFASQKLNLPPNVRTIGRVSDHDLAFLMERALCLAFPSWSEGFGLPIIEAMARRCPVIASDRSSMPEVSGNAALLASPADPATWIAHVRALCGSRDLREELVGRGRERIRLFSWSETASGYLELMRAPRARLAARPQLDRPMPTVAVVVATLGRPEIVGPVVRHLLATQSLAPAAVVISCVSADDAGEAADIEGVRVVTGLAGLAAQRNRALNILADESDIVVFLDDDFVADPDWLATAARTFRDEPDVVGFTGLVIADGIKSSGLSLQEALRALEAGPRETKPRWIESYSPYGCNMAFRLSAICDLRFDERLVLYGWLEDRDFGAMLARRGGRLVRCPDATGVHMGVKGGRMRGERLGYSQVVNPLYMLRKGTMTRTEVAHHVSKNLARNIVGAIKPERFIDRRGRLRGNLLGLFDILRGRCDPERALRIGTSVESNA